MVELASLLDISTLPYIDIVLIVFIFRVFVYIKKACYHLLVTRCKGTSELLHFSFILVNLVCGFHIL